MVVSYARADVLAPWYHHLYTFGLLTALVISVFVLGAILLMVQARTLARKTGILEATLENMTHGLCMFDASEKLTISNRRFAEMYGLSEGQTKPGTTLRTILEIGHHRSRTRKPRRNTSTGASKRLPATSPIPPSTNCRMDA